MFDLIQVSHICLYHSSPNTKSTDLI